jgi:hypothetical protein
MTALAALSVGAFAALTPAAPAAATGKPAPRATLTGSADCTADGWRATWTFTNGSSRRTAVLTDVSGALNPVVPISVQPGDSLTLTTDLPRSRQHARLRVVFHWERATPTATPTMTTPPPTTPPTPPPTTTPPSTPPSSSPPPDEEPPPIGEIAGEVAADAAAGTLRVLTDDKSHRLSLKVWQCHCPPPTTTSPPTTTAPPTTPPTTPPSTPPSSSVPSSGVPTEPTETAPPPPFDNTSGNLPLTGAPAGLIALGGLALLAAGVIAAVTMRHRRTRFTA